MVMVLDEFSKWLLTLNVHLPHSIAKVIELAWLLVVAYVSCAFVAVAVGLLMQNRYLICPVCVCSDE